jgi:exopolyphosphatase/pppGpp-phosphohydrolase
VTTVAALALGLEAYDAGLIHHARIGVGAVQEQTARLLAMPQAERARLGVMHPGRVDVIGGGALVLEAIMTRFGFAEVLASEHDILDGIAVAGAGRLRCPRLSRIRGPSHHPRLSLPAVRPQPSPPCPGNWRQAPAVTRA